MSIIFNGLTNRYFLRVPSDVANLMGVRRPRVRISGQGLFALCASWFLFSSSALCGDPVADFYTQRTQALVTQSLQHWQHASTASARASSRTGSVGIQYNGKANAMAALRERAVRNYLAKLVPTTKPSPEVSHIPNEYPVPVDVSDSKKIWTAYYAQAKNGLRPDVEYRFTSNADGNKAGTVTLSEAHIENFRDNFDILMWYRNELESRATQGKHRADKKFKLFLDFFVADLLKSLPSGPRISIATGLVDAPKWEVDERRLREQLIMAFRYLFAKYQIYPEYERFGPADRELLITMMKIALLMGANMSPQWFQENDVNLKAVTEKAKWKAPMADALGVLKTQSEQNDTPVEAQLYRSARNEEPCIIPIPPHKRKPAAKPASPAKKASQPKRKDEQKIEIIIRPKP